MPHQALFPKDLAPPIGAYSPAIQVGNMLFISGQVALDGDGNVVAVGDMSAQAQEVFRNLGSVLAAAGGGPEDLVSLTIFVTDMSRRGEVAAARRAFVREPFPASSLVGVSELAHPDLLVEVEAIAVLDDATPATHG